MMSMKKILIAALVAVVATSCGVYKKYERPAGITPQNLYGDSYQAEDTASIATLGWRELFKDPYLQGLIERGLEANTDLRTAELRVEQARTALGIARMSYLPSFNFVPDGGTGSFDDFNGIEINFGKTYTLPVAASWELDIFGKKTNAKRGARASYDMTKDYELAVKTGLISGIATQYYTLLMLDEQLVIASETAAKLGESVRVLRAMMGAGMANEVAVSQMEGAWYEVSAAVEDIKKAINELQNSLSTTLALPPHTIERGKLSDAQFPHQLNAGIPLQLLSRRPDVMAAEKNLARIHYIWNESRAKMYPSINLSGVAGWTNSVGESIINPGGLLLNAVASLTQPLFNAGAIRGEAKINRAEKEAAELAFRQSLLDAGAEVNNALTEYQTALAKEQLRIKQVASLGAAVEKTRKLMQYTSTTYLEVLTAEQSLLQARNLQAQDSFEKIHSVIKLYHALGGGQN